MRENNVRRQRDRSYLCIMTIYVIHAILLNVVFPQPKLDNVYKPLSSMSSNYIINSNNNNNHHNGDLFARRTKNSSESVISKIGMENFGNNVIALSNRTNSTEYIERRNIVIVDNDNHEYATKLSTNAFLQSKSDGTSIRFFSIAENSSVLRLTNNAINAARSIIERLSPAELGIISGCLVFLLTFTENV